MYQVRQVVIGEDWLAPEYERWFKLAYSKTNHRYYWNIINLKIIIDNKGNCKSSDSKSKSRGFDRNIIKWCKVYNY